MTDVSETEARSLLGRRLYCEDCCEWIDAGNQTGTYRIHIGLTDGNARSADLSVELIWRQENKNERKHFVFTVWRRNPYGVERVYQLDIRHAGKKFYDRHKQSHEHFGTARRLCPTQPSSWDFGASLAYFCSQTNICFRPPPTEPCRVQTRN